jgi:exodeoxyribonuclease VII small subunit
VSRPAEAEAGEQPEPRFEELQAELEDIVGRLERGDVPVDEALRLWRRGEELYRLCVARLDAAEGQVEELSRDPSR